MTYFADNPYIWAPRLIDILEGRSDETIGSECSKYGFDKLVIPATATYVTNRFTTLTERFNERYYYRRINQESLARWQVRLQNRMDEIVDEMDRAYRLYATTTAIDEVVRGSKITYGHSTAHTGIDSNSNTNNGTYIDTPDSAVNATDNYADRRSKNAGSSTTTYGSTQALSGTDTTQVTGPEILGGVNQSIRSWVDIDTYFVSMFENNFLNIFD